MRIKIESPVCIFEKGNRRYNQDYIYPLLGKATKRHGLFIVCDGVGGEKGGEAASQITAVTLANYLKKNAVKYSTKAYWQQALQMVYQQMDRHIAKNPLSKRMATTLALLHIHSRGITLAHIGDSRIYHIRNNNIIFRTTDHSWVQEMVENGVISEAQAVHHPDKNVVTKTVHRAKNTPIQPDCHYIVDIQPDDCFFLCSDGVWECLPEQQLCQVLSLPISNQQKMEKIRQHCLQEARDNFSAYLIDIKKVRKKWTWLSFIWR